MTFFDEAGKVIPAADWMRRYEPYYFLGDPSSKRVNRRNKTSPFIEDQVCALLNKSTFLSKDDLVLLMAWKLGLVDHGSSEEHKKIIFKQDFGAKLISTGQFRPLDFSKSIPYLATNMAEIVKNLTLNPQYLVNKVRGPHPELEGFGITYILTVQFFVTHGKYPIYDKFAHIGAIAICQDLKPGAPIEWASVQDWNDYLRYVELLNAISAACSQSGSSSPMTVPRPVDRALWVYGHFFQQAKTAKSLPTMTGTRSLRILRILKG